MSHCLRLSAVAFGLLLSACQMVGPDYHLPNDGAINRSDLQGSLATRDSHVVSSPVPAEWWKLYNDPRLDQLVNQALVSSTDLRVAAANLNRARAHIDEARAEGGFTTKADAGAQRLQESAESYLQSAKLPVDNVGSIALTTSYQFDIWGTLKRGVEATQANADAAQAAADTARITLVAEVVRSYAQICAANEERSIALKSLDLQAEGVRQTQQLRDAGRGDDTQVTRTQTQLSSLSAELPKFEARRQAALYKLGMLLATPVNQLPVGVAGCSELPTINQVMPVGDGAAMLKRRPDVRQAERKLAAATAEIGVTTGQLYPDISIGATVGSVGTLRHMGQDVTNRWGLGPLISWTIPGNGARARIREAEASTQEALARFDGVVLNAVREAQTDLVQYTALLQRRDALIATEKSARQAAEQTHRFYVAGRESFLADLQATKTYTDTTAQLSAANTEVSMQQINLFLALGGGWQSNAVNVSAGTSASLK